MAKSTVDEGAEVNTRAAALPPPTCPPSKTAPGNTCWADYRALHTQPAPKMASSNQQIRSTPVQRKNRAPWPNTAVNSHGADANQNGSTTKQYNTPSHSK